MPSIADYGFLSDCRGAALVDRRGSVDWWCVPRFDSPSVFGRLLGPDAGHWSLSPAEPFTSVREYLDDTLVIRTVHPTESGTVAVLDALALGPGARGHDIGKDGPSVLLRTVEGLDGSVRLRTVVAPRMEYGRTEPHLRLTADGFEAWGGPVSLDCSARSGNTGTAAVDILVNNAGVDASGKKVAELDTATWDRAIRTNLYGYFFCARRFVQLRQAAGGGGRIINVTSVHQDIPNPGGADYDCSKAGERMLTRTLALELAEQGITVNTLAPGMVLTPFNQAAIDDPELLDQQVQSIPMKRAAHPEEIARLALFLASADADYCTGAEFVMDGGLMRNLGQGA